MRAPVASVTALTLLVVGTACHKHEAPPPPTPPAAVKAQAPASPQPEQEFPTAPAAPPACNPVGIWHLVETRTNASGGACASDAFARRELNTVAATLPGPNQIRWTEADYSVPVTVDMDFCTIEFDAESRTEHVAPPPSQAADGGTADGGEAYTSILKLHTKLKFDGSNVFGTLEGDFSTDPKRWDTPCHLTYEIHGTRP